MEEVSFEELHLAKRQTYEAGFKAGAIAKAREYAMEEAPAGEEKHVVAALTWFEWLVAIHVMLWGVTLVTWSVIAIIERCKRRSR